MLQDGSVMYQAGLGSHQPNEAWRVEVGKMSTLLSDGTGRGRASYGVFCEIFPDGAYAYFAMKPASDPFSPYFSDVYRTPVGGGTPEPVLEREPAGATDIVNHYAIGFIPDQTELL